jgi:hypothetical protein
MQSCQDLGCLLPEFCVFCDTTYLTGFEACIHTLTWLRKGCFSDVGNVPALEKCFFFQVKKIKSRTGRSSKKLPHPLRDALCAIWQVQPRFFTSTLPLLALIEFLLPIFTEALSTEKATHISEFCVFCDTTYLTGFEACIHTLTSLGKDRFSDPLLALIEFLLPIFTEALSTEKATHISHGI